ncbi:MAG: hypothetical protein EOO88_28020 [Pedobacter sp.]|nr:MAG: hypothetical protein EOO88_28020 [Pedobacter sp.]
MRLFVPFIVLCAVAFTACRKSNELTEDENVKLFFSSDTVYFDTVFTSVGSANKRLKIYNKDPKAVKVSHIRLSGESGSYFSLIINGTPANQLSDLQIDGNDSISIYVKVNINPDDQYQPFIVQDSILFSTNGNRQAVPLVAYGQNAIFIDNQVISSTSTWTSTLPYIIFRSVTVAAGVTLNIRPGTKVLFHGYSAMHIHGSLKTEGTKDQPVLFASDRLEPYYNEEPGQWNGIHFHSNSGNSSIKYAQIENAIVGITVDSLSLNSSPKLLLSHTLIKNMQAAGLAGYGADLAAFNNLFYNCGKYLFYGVGGGKYNLKQNTFAGYNTSLPRNTPAVYFSDLSPGYLSGNLNVELVNNIIWGTLSEEILIDKKTGFKVETNIQNNILKTQSQNFDGQLNLLNINPLFASPNVGNFELQTASPAFNEGVDLRGDTYFNLLSRDLNNAIRTFPSDLGCFQKK